MNDFSNRGIKNISHKLKGIIFFVGLTATVLLGGDRTSFCENAAQEKSPAPSVNQEQVNSDAAAVQQAVEIQTSAAPPETENKDSREISSTTQPAKPEAETIGIKKEDTKQDAVLPQATGASLQESKVPETLPSEVVWIKGILPATSSTDGGWLWDDKMGHGDVISHTNIEYKGIQSHSFRTDAVARLSGESKVMQYVFIDPKSPPSGIMMKLFLGKDGEIIVYWENDEEAFVDLGEYVKAWYMATLPKLGEWVKLEVDIKKFNIQQVQLEGISFITNNGKAWWGETIIINR